MQSMTIKKYLIKLLRRDIFKTRLSLILDYAELVCIAFIVIILGYSPCALGGLILKETQKYSAIIPILSAILTIISFCLVCTHSKVEEFYSKCVERIRAGRCYIQGRKFHLKCIKKHAKHNLTAYEEIELEKFLTKLKISIKEL